MPRLTNARVRDLLAKKITRNTCWSRRPMAQLVLQPAVEIANELLPGLWQEAQAGGRNPEITAYRMLYPLRITGREVRMSKLVRTVYGYLEAEALDALQDSFDTMELLECADAVASLRDSLDQFHTEVLALHGMAAHIVNNSISASGEGSGENIHEQADVVDCAAFNLIETGEQIQRVVAPLTELLSDAVLDRMESDPR